MSLTLLAAAFPPLIRKGALVSSWLDTWSQAQQGNGTSRKIPLQEKQRESLLLQGIDPEGDGPSRDRNFEASPSCPSRSACGENVIPLLRNCPLH